MRGLVELSASLPHDDGIAKQLRESADVTLIDARAGQVLNFALSVRADGAAVVLE